MKLTTLFLLLAMVQVSASVVAQPVTLSEKNASLEQVLDKIRQQTGFDFLFSRSMLKSANPINIQVTDTDLDEVLNRLFADQPLKYTIEDRSVVISKKELRKIRSAAEPANLILAYAEIKGRVVDSTGAALVGASVRVLNAEGQRTTLQTKTDRDGLFILQNVPDDAALEISYVGYITQTIPAAADMGAVTLAASPSDLDEVQVIGYGQVSKRFNTGSVVTVTAEEIERQPVSNPLAALAGRVPGMMVTQSGGEPGSKVNIQIRGQNSISQGSQPLFIIDGVPFQNDNMGTGAVTMVNGGQSPFDNINPNDIEQIDVLKDADATAIYGSRGANGVVLITTKRGKAGKTKLDASVYQGQGRITRRMELLNTQQYVAMRKEAFANDGIEPTASNAPDLILWDTTRYTDWQEEFIGGTAHFTNANASLSGGNANTQFLVSGNCNRQTAVYPGEFAQNRGGGLVNVSHTSSDSRLKALASASYSVNNNQLPPTSLVTSINMPPNTTPLLDADGNLVWSENGGAFNNPYNVLFRRSIAETGNLITNLGVDYELFDGLRLRFSGGYNLVQVNDSYFDPKASRDPNGSAIEASSKFANATNNSWILEPQVEYAKAVGRGNLSFLLGMTHQNSTNQFYAIDATGFPNDALLEATEFATSVTTRTSVVEYRYQAAFGRINYNYNGKYLLNLTARRDGSSRFGPDKRVANFGAIGGAWIFSEESFLDGMTSWLSFGKIRGSYGVTGNDQIGDYGYLDNYRAANRDYQGVLGYIPLRMFNADYTWERNRKLEAALELGFLADRIFFNINWFRNKSDNQLINYRLPDQTGFPSILRNFGALVQNSGVEIELRTTVIKNNSLDWSIGGNITRDRNKLLEFEGLESSSYANSLVIGYPLGIAKYLHWTSVDPETGLHAFDGMSRPADQTVIADFTPRFYGGINNNINWRNWDLSFFFQFVKQNGVSYLTSFGGSSAFPGSRLNQPIAVLDRWQKPGDNTDVQRFTTRSTPEYQSYASYSDARITDASFIRLRNLEVAYSLPSELNKLLKLQTLKVYFQAQNLFTWTNYAGLDPETGAARQPPLAISTFGIQLTL